MGMIFEKLELEGVKSFESRLEIPLFSGETEQLMTISGPNGSGKSAIVEALAALQSAFLVEHLNHRFSDNESNFELIATLRRRLKNLISRKRGKITLYIRSGDQQGELGVTFSNEIQGVEYHLVRCGELADALVANWTADHPSNLILAIPSTKYFNQDDVFFTRLREYSDSGSELESFLVDWDLKPLVVDLASGMQESYRRILEDWFYERISPGRKRTVYQKIANIYLNTLFPDVMFSNFSATAKSGEISCLAKRGADGSALYDVRNLSSGEKYVFLLFSHLAHFLGKVGLVIFDEPENHLHENTLVRFVELLRSGMDDPLTFGQQINSLARQCEAKEVTEKELGALKFSEAEGALFGAPILVTHSKLVVRRNIGYGPNLLLRNGTIQSLGREDAEQKLRAAGVSQVDEQVIFVEGDTDTKAFEHYFQHQNVEFRSLNGRDAVCEAFSGFARLDPHNRHPGHVFILDLDSPNDYRYEKLKETFPDKWESHVIVLDRTELENYFLEPVLFRTVFSRILEDEEMEALEDVLSDDSLNNLFREAADQTLDLQRGSFLRREIERARERQLELPKPREISSDFSSFTNQMKAVVSDDQCQGFIESCEHSFDLCKEHYGSKNWDLKWRNLCKGKRTLPNACSKIADEVGVEGIGSKLIRSRVIKLASKSTEIDLFKILTKCEQLLNQS